PRHQSLPSFLFFFEAETAIRPLYVTGVQTCALPISCSHLPTTLSTTGSADANRPPKTKIRGNASATPTTAPRAPRHAPPLDSSLQRTSLTASGHMPTHVLTAVATPPCT